MIPKRPRFDFIESAVDGYRLSWLHSRELLHVAFIPFAVKFLCYLAVVFAGVQDNYLRQGLVLLPSSFAEGWFIAYALRLTLLGERWPALLTGDAVADQNLMFSRRRCLKISVGVYVLIKLASAFVLGFGMHEYGLGQEVADKGAEYSGPVDFYFVAVVLFALLLWAFRYMWLYVPAALGYSIQAFLKAIYGWMGSFQLMGVWFVCFAPFVIVLMFVTNILDFLFPGAELELENLLYVIVWSGVQSVMELTITLVASIAVASGVYEVMEGKRR